MSSSDVRRALLAAGLTIGFAAASAATADVDLAALKIVPQRGQSADQARRDRYECHNWAVEQTGTVPVAAPPARDRERSDEERAKRADRIERVLNGAAIGAGLGGLVRAAEDKNPSRGVLAGAAVGAAVGATTGRAKEGAVEVEEASDYVRALTACLEGRGYTVALPGAEPAGEVAAAR